MDASKLNNVHGEEEQPLQDDDTISNPNNEQSDNVHKITSPQDGDVNKDNSDSKPQDVTEDVVSETEAAARQEKEKNKDYYKVENDLQESPQDADVNKDSLDSELQDVTETVVSEAELAAGQENEVNKDHCNTKNDLEESNKGQKIVESKIENSQYDEQNLLEDTNHLITESSHYCNTENNLEESDKNQKLLESQKDNSEYNAQNSLEAASHQTVDSPHQQHSHISHHANPIFAGEPFINEDDLSAEEAPEDIGLESEIQAFDRNDYNQSEPQNVEDVVAPRQHTLSEYPDVISGIAKPPSYNEESQPELEENPVDEPDAVPRRRNLEKDEEKGEEGQELPPIKKIEDLSREELEKLAHKLVRKRKQWLYISLIFVVIIWILACTTAIYVFNFNSLLDRCGDPDA